MSQYADFIRQDVRLVILRLLVEMTAYRANSSVLTMALDSYGHTLSRDQVKTEMHWLAEQGALTVAEVGPVLVATLNERGQDIAAGRARVHGIKRPGA
ncbi:ArsR family transcriptional regulator [Pseudomonas sp. NPDC096950]|uniref:VpaChn25_0724 family phage protein n=1 Tax=Pseudomonas sp. NPDC096950 TaxID=3364485 RepID=UPI00383A3CAF